MNEIKQSTTLHTIIDNWLKITNHLKQTSLKTYIRYCNMIKSHFDKMILTHHITK